MRKTTNTEREPRLDWLFGGNPRAIENQEAQGQSELVNSDQLPAKANSYGNINPVEQYEKMGIKVIGQTDGDELFLDVVLPEGWKKQATDHSMWNNLVDDKGRVRAMFFYKAAFYDRDSFINFKTRYETSCDFSDKTSMTYIAKDTATGEVIYKAPIMTRDCNDPDYFKNQDAFQAQCRGYLDTNFPDWNDINAYW